MKLTVKENGVCLNRKSRIMWETKLKYPYIITHVTDKAS